MKLCLNDLTVGELNWIENNCSEIAVDSETTGLDPIIDELCLIQIAAGGEYFVIKILEGLNEAPNICRLMGNKKIIKIFHNANFDMRFIMKNLNCNSFHNVVCTKIAGKILNGLNEPNSLKSLVYRYLGIELDKSQQTSNWKAKSLNNAQIEYAIGDVRYLKDLWYILKDKLSEKSKLDLVQRCFDFLPTQSYLENQGIPNIFKY